MDLSKHESMNSVWNTLETLFSIVFKICFYIYLEAYQYKFYYIPCILLLYVVIRFFFVISRKLQENGTIQVILNESFTWGFKIFFMGQLFLIAVKMNDKVDWSWQDIFWPYWIFFYIMIGANSVIFILWMSKIVLRCLGQPVQMFEIIGLFWFLLLSNGLCANSTLFVKGVVSNLDNGDPSSAEFAFRFNFATIFGFVIYTVFFWNNIWMFIIHFSSEKDIAEDEESGNKVGGDQNQGREQQANQAGQGRNQGTNQNADGVSEDTSKDEDRFGEDEDYPEEVIQANSSSSRARQSQNQQEQPQNGAEQKAGQPSQKVYKQVNLLSKQRLKKNIPLFLEKLSSTYFTAFTRNTLKVKKSASEKTTNAKQDDQKSRQKPSNILTASGNKKNTSSASNENQIDLQEINRQGFEKKKKSPGLIQFDEDSSDEGEKNEIKGESGEEKNNQKGKGGAKNKRKKQLSQEVQQKAPRVAAKEKVKKISENADDSNKGVQDSRTAKEIDQSKSKGVQNSVTDKGHNTLDESHSNCLICFENDPDTVFLPCGHGGICYECGMDVIKRTGECYLCRNEIDSVVQIDVKSKNPQKKIIAATAAVDQKSEEGSQISEKSVIELQSSLPSIASMNSYADGKGEKQEDSIEISRDSNRQESGHGNQLNIVELKQAEEIDQIPGGDVSREDTNQSEDRNRNPIQINNLQHRQNELITRHLTQEENLDFQFMKESGTSIIGEGSGANTMNQLRNCEEEVLEEEGREQGAVEDIVEEDEDKKANSQIIIN